MTEAPPGRDPLAATVLICSRDRPGLVLETIRSVLAGTAVPRELLVVDQSAIRHPEIARMGVVRGCEVRYLHTASSGLSRGRNIGLRAASNDIVVFIDDDMLVDPGWLERLLEAMSAGDPRMVATGRVLAGPREGTGATVPPAALVTDTTAATYSGRQPRDVVPGANVALHRDVVLALGGYDERLGAGARFAAADDNDIGFRLLEAGCEVHHVPKAVVFHRAWRKRNERIRMRWTYGRGKGAFYAKHMSRSDRHMFERMRSDARMRIRAVLGSLRSSPGTSVSQAVYLVGMLSGVVGWFVRERGRSP